MDESLETVVCVTDVYERTSERQRETRELESSRLGSTDAKRRDRDDAIDQFLVTTAKISSSLYTAYSFPALSSPSSTETPPNSGKATTSPALTSSGTSSPVEVRRPGPTANTVASRICDTERKQRKSARASVDPIHSSIVSASTKERERTKEEKKKIHSFIHSSSASRLARRRRVSRTLLDVMDSGSNTPPTDFVGATIRSTSTRSRSGRSARRAAIFLRTRRRVTIE